MQPVQVAASEPPKAKPPRPARNYLFTINFSVAPNGNYVHVPRLLDCELWGAHSVKYCVYQLECGANGTLHFQGYLECRGNKSYVQLQTLEGLERAHFIQRRGSQKDNIAYCTKRDESYMEGPWIWGEPSEQGKRNDLLDIQPKLHRDVPLTEIAFDHFGSWIRNGKALTEYKRMVTPIRDFKSRVFLFIGPAGAGKSTLAKLIGRYIGSLFKVAQKKGSGLYYDGYDGQDILFIDEFNGNKMTPEDFNTLCDEHECVLPVHGGAGHQMRSKFIFIVSNYMPSQWWKNRSKSQLRQTTRRIDVTFRCAMGEYYRGEPRAPSWNWVHRSFQAFGPNINEQRVSTSGALVRVHTTSGTPNLVLSVADPVPPIVGLLVEELPPPPAPKRRKHFLSEDDDDVVVPPKDKGELFE